MRYCHRRRGYEDSGTVYFTANKDDPREEKLFSVKLDGSGLRAISAEPGINTATFDQSGKHYLETHSSTLAPATDFDLHRRRTCNKIWEARSVADYNSITPKQIEFKAEDGTTLYGYLILPPTPVQA